VGGQRFCSNVDQGGYAIFAAMAALAPDFFIANGDMIYAGRRLSGRRAGWPGRMGETFLVTSPASPMRPWTGPDTEQVRDVYLRHYRYNRADPFYQAFSGARRSSVSGTTTK
jgi:phosphodiesterase/alkaline phosphatase D-like protein